MTVLQEFQVYSDNKDDRYYDKCLSISARPTLLLYIHVQCHILVHNPRMVNNVNNLDELLLQGLQIYTEAICNTETVQCDN